MLGFYLKKILALLATLFSLSVILFLTFYWIPGDPALIMLGPSASQEAIDQIHEEIGYDQAIWDQYRHNIGSYFSTSKPLLSYRLHRPVRELIHERLGLSLSLMLLALVWILLISLPLALLATYHAGRFLDRAIGLSMRLFLSLPAFLMALFLALFFSFVLHWYRPGQSLSPVRDLIPYLKALLLPSLAVALPRAAQAYQFLRSALEHAGRQDFVKTARAKGASRRRILLRHVLRNALVPYVTAISLVLSELILGTLVVEQVFSLPGLGQLLFMSVAQRDFPLAQSLLLCLAVSIVSINTLADLINISIDPRLRRTKEIFS
ncbi:MAG: ABC transporter permease [Eubacteriales bacterium]|nr:ABC transporter permease [Eubacteriales bacterium]